MNDIDFIIPWVDDSDLNWVNEKNKYLAKLDNTKESKAMAASKAYRDWEILVYWFRAVEKYAPWVRKIHFVTFGQIPKWLDTNNPKLDIVNHNDYLPKSALPTFNSRAIEVNFHRINDLSERFVYFNDDMFINNYVSKKDFFVNQFPKDIGILSPIIAAKYGTSAIQVNDMEIINDAISFTEAKKNYIGKYLNLKYGKNNLRTLFLMQGKHFPGFFEPHLPNSFLKSTFRELWLREREILNQTTNSKFKNKYNVNQWLFRYWQLAKGNFVPREFNFGKYYELSNQENSRLFSDISKGTHKVICINDSYSITEIDQIKKNLINVFEKKLPQKSSFEI